MNIRISRRKLKNGSILGVKENLTVSNVGGVGFTASIYIENKEAHPIYYRIEL